MQDNHSRPATPDHSSSNLASRVRPFYAAGDEQEQVAPMNAIVTSLVVAAFVFAGGIGGLYLHRLVPEEHLSAKTQDVVRLGTGMLSVLASLVLGLLVATAKASFDTTDTAVRTYAADLILLDETLRDYGEDALAPRRLLRDYTALVLHDGWGETGAPPFLAEDRAAGDVMEHVREAVRALAPVDAGQKWLQDQALDVNISLLRQRWLLIEQSGPSVRPVTIGILTAWITAIFASFGLNAPRNRTVAVAFLICALAIGSAIFLILQLDSPFDGLLKISSEPMRTALAHMLPAGK
jgi:hypothetical protein